MNIRIDYMFRDESNYKTRSSEVFRNQFDYTEIQILDSTDWTEFNFIYPNECGLTELDGSEPDLGDYPLYHEIEEIAETSMPATIDEDIYFFISHFKGYN